MRKAFGAEDQNNLEPIPLNSILDELEELAQYITSEPELIHKLQAFEKAANGTIDDLEKSPARPARSRGPSL